MGGDFGFSHGIADQSGDAVEDRIVIVVYGVIESEVGGTDRAGGVAQGLGVTAGSKKQHWIEMRIKAPLGAARIVGLVFEGVVGADAHLEMKVRIGGRARLSHDAYLGPPGNGVALGITRNQVVGAGAIGGGFIVPEVKIPRVEFGDTFVIVGQRAAAQFRDVVLQNYDISAG